jgi:hypothetical protein
MNYLIMKSIVEATIAHFECKNCSGKITDRDVQILGTSGQTVNMEVLCPHCKASGVIKAEINVVGNAADIAKLQNIGMNAETLFQLDAPIIPKAQPIKDADILALREKLKHTDSVEDLLS